MHKLIYLNIYLLTVYHYILRRDTFALSDAKVVYITAIFGEYETRLKQIHNQTLKSDWICFSNNTLLISSYGWEVDYTPYHEIYPSLLDSGNYYNSLTKNKHPFNIAKYYKENFQNIPRLKSYEIVVWIDASLEIEFEGTSEWVYNKIHNIGERIIVFHHDFRHGNLEDEAIASDTITKYNDPNWLGKSQPIQYCKVIYYYFILLLLF